MNEYYQHLPPDAQTHRLDELNERYWQVAAVLASIVAERAILMNDMRETRHGV